MAAARAERSEARSRSDAASMRGAKSVLIQQIAERLKSAAKPPTKS